MATLRRVKAGDPITADLLNELAERLERAANLTVAPGSELRMFEGPAGKHFVLANPRPIWARLSGSTSPYSFTEVQPAVGGTWTTLGNRTGSNAYELNNLAGLDGKIVKLKWTNAGDWRFNYPRAGPVILTQTFLVYGCNGNGFPGAVITLKQSGATIATCTTGDGTGGTILGQCTVSVPRGSYDVTITASGSGFADHSSTMTISGTTTLNVTLNPDSGYVCGCNGTYPVPTTLYLTDGLGLHTLSYIGSGFWQELFSDYTDTIKTSAPTCGVGTVMPVTYTLNCSGWQLTVTWPYDCCGAQPWYVESSTLTGITTAIGSRTEHPFSVTLTLPTSDTTIVCPLETPGGNGATTPGGGGIITITP